MGAPVVALTRETCFLEWTGRYEIWMIFTWTEVETGPCHYLVEKHNIANNTWEQQGVADKGDAFLKVKVGYQAPGDNWQYHQTHDQVRVTCILDPTDPSPGVTTNTFVFPTSRSKQALTNRSLHIVSLSGNSCVMDVKGDDDSTYLYCANLHVYNMSQGQRLIYHRQLNEGTAALAINYCDHRLINIGFTVTGSDVPNFGDRIQVHYVGIIGNGKSPGSLNAQNDGTESIFTVTFSGPVNFPFLSLSATQGNNFAYSVASAPGATGNPYAATYSLGSGTLPPGLTLASDGWLTGTPTSTGTWNFHVNTVSEMGDLGGGDVRVIVGVSQLPVITAPPSPQVLDQYAPVSLQLVATNHPSSYAVASGTLPTGLSLNTSTGVISGTPTAIQSASTVQFTATNTTGPGPQYGISFSVTALPLPIVTSASTATAYRGETWTYRITASNSPIAFTAAPLPLATSVDGTSGLISGVINPASNPPGTFRVTLRAQNYTGYSTPFTLTLTIADRVPRITSDLSITATCYQQFRYQITATGYPVTYGATDLNDAGLTIDAETGLITGFPINPGTFSIGLSATNSAGTGTATLVLILKLERPVIDTSITAGKAITCETGIAIIFQPVATNNPTSWTCMPGIEGFILEESTGKFSGIFSTVGLYGQVFEAFNAAGASDPATFYFLVELGSSGSVTVLGSGLDIWIDLQDGGVSIHVPGDTMAQTVTTTQNGTTTETKSTVPSPTEKAILWSKRGDTLPLTIRFHKGGKPVLIENMTSLKFGVREDFTSPYAVLAALDNPVPNEDGSYDITPNYADNAEIDFEIDDEEEFLELLAEVQWETNDPKQDVFTRRSSQTFKNQIYRDVIYPDTSA